MTNQLLMQTNAYLQKLHVQWAICGGYALDLFLNKEIRTHSDIDICVFESDRDRIVDFMLANNWKVYEFLGRGRVRPLRSKEQSEPKRNLMCLREN